MQFEKGYNKKGSSGTQSQIGYTVEARYNYHEPLLIGNQIFDIRWRQVNFENWTISIPRCSTYSKLGEHNLLSYEAAQALRWSLHAIAGQKTIAICLETRLVSHELSSSFSIEAKEYHDHVHGEDRSNCIPDWNKKEVK